MLQEYPTTRCTRKCHLSGRQLEAGESYVSALVPSGEDLVRIDIAANQWTAPPEGTVGWWRCRMPAASAARLKPAPIGVLLDSLTELLKYPNRQKLAYLLALILYRRKALADVQHLDFSEKNPADEICWRLVSPADGRQWEVPIGLPTTTEEAQRLRQELMDLLFTEE